MSDSYINKSLFFGDIHNHCGISYGHGALEDALKNAKMQLDFVSITGHSFWPDMPKPEGHLKEVVDYHVKGFNKLEKRWPGYLETIDTYNISNEFVTFPSYEMHSIIHGDYVVYCRDRINPMVKPNTFEELQEFVREQNEVGFKCFIVPHHIGYAQGYRGINWKTFNEYVSPLVEILSMHGCAESDEAPFHYLHTMGPRNGNSTMQGGLAEGHHFGVIGSTDHHSGHPGSYGYGAAAVWAENLSRESIWNALEQGRTYAISGDKIQLEYSINGSAMGSILPFAADRSIDISVKGVDSLDRVEIVKNNRVLKRYDYINHSDINTKDSYKGKVNIAVGWGEKGIEQNWDVHIKMNEGEIISSEPHFHGTDVVAPEDKHESNYRFTHIKKDNNSEFHFSSSTWGNSTSTTDGTQGVVLEIEGNLNSKLNIIINDQTFNISIMDIISASQSHYLGGFLTGALHVGRFIPEDEYTKVINLTDIDNGKREDFYYVRVGQRNNQWAWSTPIWIKGDNK